MQLSLVLLLALIPSLVLASSLLNCNDTYQCICGNGDDEELFGKFVHCHTEKRIVHVDILMCITYENKLDMFVVGNCPFSSRMLSTAHQNGQYALPNGLFSAISPTNFNTDVMCHPMNRTGRNCGKCNNVTAVAINSYFLQCVPREECHWYNWLLMLLANLGPVTILFIIIVVFHIRFTSGYANAYIFFAQIVSMQINVIQLERNWVNVLANTSSADDIVIPLISVYSIWSLDLGRCIAPNLCTNHHITNIHAFLFQYIIALYGLVLIITVYVLVELHAHNVRLVVWLWRPFRMCFARFQRQLNAKTSLIDALATFLLLSYSKFVLTSIMLLAPTELFNRTDNVVGLVLLYDGSVDYFGTEHMPLAVLAIIVLIIFVLLPPLAMILYPFKCVQRCLTRCRLNRPALVAFMDAIQGCYKDGTNGTCDLRFFSAVYWLARVVIFALYAMYARLDKYPELQYYLLFIYSCLFIIVATLRPYKRNIYNHFDVAMLAYFVLVVGDCMYHWTQMFAFRHTPGQKYEIFSFFLLMMPFLVAVGYVLVKLCMFVRSSACIRQLAPSISHTRPGYLFSNLRNLPIDSSQSNPFPDRLLRPEEYTEDNMQSRGARRFYGAV